MRISYEWFIAVRFLKEGRMQSVLIFVGVAFGVAVMVFVSALLAGLQASLVAKTLSVQPHIVLNPADLDARDVGNADGAAVFSHRQKNTQRPKSIDDWRRKEATVGAVPGVKAVASTVRGSVLVSRAGATSSVTLMGVEPRNYTRIVDIEGKMIAGHFRLGASEAVIGRDLAGDLGVGLGDKVRVVYTKDSTAIFSVVGLFDMGNKQVNQRWLFVPIREAQSLLDLASRVTDMEVRVNNVYDAEVISRHLAVQTGLQTDSWMTLNEQLLQALRSQSASGYVINVFVILAVALGISSVLAVSVVNKAREIGIMKATGTSRHSVMRIFMLQGALVGLIGSLLGALIGALFLVMYVALMKNPDGTMPFTVELEWERFAQAIVIATVLGLVSAVVPARRAASLDPAEVIAHG